LASKDCENEATFRQALSRFATGIVVVTTQSVSGCPRAITINAFTSVSLNPPLVLFCLGKSAYQFGIFAEAPSFAVNVLSADQQALSDRFAQEAEDDLADVSFRRLMTGSPILSGCLTALDCITEKHFDAGDHLIVVGKVQAIDEPRDDEPLIYFESGYRRLKLPLDS